MIQEYLGNNEYKLSFEKKVIILTEDEIDELVDDILEERNRENSIPDTNAFEEFLNEEPS